MGDLWSQGAHGHIRGLSQLLWARQSATARAVHGEQKGTTIKREMQSEALEMSRTLAAQNATWAPHHIPWILFLSSVFFWFCLSLIFTRARWKVTAEARHIHTVLSTTSPPPSFWFIYPTPQHFHCPVPDSITPFTINTQQQPVCFYGQGALLLRSHNYKFILQPLIPCGFSTSSGLPLSCTWSLLFSHWHMHLDPGSLAHMQDTKSPPAVVNSK